MTTLELAEQLLRGDRRALARLLTHIENGVAEATAALTRLYPHTGRAHLIGVTGAPGTGKSTLVTALAQGYRAEGRTVAVLAVDPTSPFTGGAILGDRIRMRDLSGDPGVFIRSMASRGSAGGLARASLDAMRVLDAAGFDIVLVETVGAGQGEVDIARAAQTTLVVEAPGMGDDVQAIKAGILEIADVLVVNKADRPGVENTVRGLRAMLELGHPTRRAMHHGRLLTADNPPPIPSDPDLWIPPIVETVASEGRGIDTLMGHIAAHRAHPSGGQTAEAERQRIELELMDRLRETLLARLLDGLPEARLRETVERVRGRELAPQDAVTLLLAEATAN
jgi:LAO/AO transport system kinase